MLIFSQNTQFIMTANAAQQQALDAIAQGRNVFITGKAGSGKSWLIDEISKQFKNVAITASTGRAACDINGETIHKWSTLGADTNWKTKADRLVHTKESEAKTKITTAQLLVIDEISMITSTFFDCLSNLLCEVRQSPPGVLFGGIQMVVVGDLLQLPPIGDTYMFDSTSWKLGMFEIVPLTVDVRHKDDRAYADLLEKLRHGVVDDEMIESLKTCIDRKFTDGIEPIELHPTRAAVDRENNTRLAALGDVETHVYLAEDSGTVSELVDCMAHPRLTLKKGCSVMLVKNLDVRNGLANGTQGVVQSFHIDSRWPMVRFANGALVTVSPATFERKKNNRLVATRLQVPLLVAYATTVHKAQGMTLDRVSVTLRNTFADSQVYVALSRVRTMEGLRIRDASLAGFKRMVRANKKALEFYQTDDDEPTAKRVKVE